MPSKGVQTYTYIAVPGCVIEVSVPGRTIRRDQINVFMNEDLEVESRNISSLFNKSGRYNFRVTRDGNLVTEQWIMVNALTGGLGDGTMNTISNTPSVLHNSGIIVSYGFYDAGHGHAGLPDRHQCYITVTPNYGSWMSLVAPPGSPQENRPFRNLALPAAHDIGMNSMQNCDALLAHAGGAVVATLVEDSKVMQEFADTISSKAVEHIAPNIVFSLAITQKDSLDTILQLGARYFEFRPAHCHRAVLPVLPFPDRLYFQHSAIPGMAYDEFLRGVVAFLLAHPTEIVVVHLRWDGVPAECRHPDEGELNEYLNNALAAANGSLAAAGLGDMLQASISDLRRDRKRLIVLNSVDSISTYSDAANATTTGDSILAAYEQLANNVSVASGHAFMNMQCQATATNIPGAVVYSVLSASASSSCLLSSKALCDSKILPWVRQNGMRVCSPEQLLVIMNDFFDGATADVGIQLSRQRLG